MKLTALYMALEKLEHLKKEVSNFNKYNDGVAGDMQETAKRLVNIIIDQQKTIDKLSQRIGKLEHDQ